MEKVLLISTYDLGRQPFGLASPAAWFAAAGVEVACLDLSLQPLDEGLVNQAGFIALYLPMHTATRLAVELIPRLRSLNPRAHLCCYGLYAPTNDAYLRSLGVDSILGGEFESGLIALYERVASGFVKGRSPGQSEATISLDRQQFLVPDRRGLPDLAGYAQLLLPDGEARLVGNTVASRGCKYRCRHCPIGPIYNGRFRIIQPDIVLADIRQQVAAGARHITFGDPDFLNGPGHTMPIVKSLHAEYPDLSYDVTVKIEHLLKYDHLLSELRDSGCLFITSAVESVDDHILDLLDKGHIRADFIRVAARMRAIGLILNPTFVAFSPWTTLEGYLDMLTVVRELGLVAQVAPIQYAIRLLIPAGSHLLDLPEVRRMVDPFDQTALSYPWQHRDPVMEDLYLRIFWLVQQNQINRESREVLFEKIWRAALEMKPDLEHSYQKENGWDLAVAPVPRLSESWY